MDIGVGGSYAGRAAASQVVRGRCCASTLDAGQRRNCFATVSHGVLAQAGRAPSAIARQAKAQLLTYPHLT